ncbi:hypothetical protein ACVXHA_20670 [Escherichia coli]
MRKFIGDHLLKFMPDKAFALHSAVQLSAAARRRPADPKNSPLLFYRH